MAERKITIEADTGLHARPAGQFARAAAAAGVPITIAKNDGAAIDASSILQVMSLGAEKGDVLVLRAEGDGADAVLDNLADELDREVGSGAHGA